MSTENQTIERPASLKSTATVFAAMSGSANSPSLPYGTYDFLLNEQGDDVLVHTAESAKGKTYSYVEVLPSGLDVNSGVPPRRVYTTALAAVSAGPILYDKATGALKSTFTAGIFQTAERATIVSTKAEDVARGIAAGLTRYREEQAAKEAAESTQE